MLSPVVTPHHTNLMLERPVFLKEFPSSLTMIEVLGLNNTFTGEIFQKAKMFFQTMII